MGNADGSLEREIDDNVIVGETVLGDSIGVVVLGVPNVSGLGLALGDDVGLIPGEAVTGPELGNGM